MRTRAIHATGRNAAALATTILVAGSFAFLFLGTAPVKGVSDLYWGLHLDGVMTLDDLFSLGHVVIYAALTTVLGRFTRTVEGWTKVVAFLVMLGLGVEILQELGGSRSFSFDDMVANGLGICVGFFVLIVIGPPRPRRRRRR